MTKFKHTPGPWEYIDATKSAAYKFAPSCVILAGNKQVASFSWSDTSPRFPSKNESQANARLIAAAPELLEALQASMAMLHPPINGETCLCSQCDFVRLRDAAITKATDTTEKDTGENNAKN